MTSWIYNCEVQQCEWVTRCLNCCLNHYVEHWIDEYRDSLVKSEAKDELQSELNNLDLIGPKLTHDDLFPYQHAQFFHEAFFELKNAYDYETCANCSPSVLDVFDSRSTDEIVDIGHEQNNVDKEHNEVKSIKASLVNTTLVSSSSSNGSFSSDSVASIDEANNNSQRTNRRNARKSADSVDEEPRMTMNDFQLDFTEKVTLTLLKMKTTLGMAELNSDVAADIFKVTFGDTGPGIVDLFSNRNKSIRYRSRRINHYYELDDDEFILFPKCSNETINQAEKLYQELDDFINLDCAPSYKQKVNESCVFLKNWRAKWSLLGTSRKRTDSDDTCDIRQKQAQVDENHCLFETPVIIETESEDESSEDSDTPANDECFEVTIEPTTPSQSPEQTSQSPSHAMVSESSVIQPHESDQVSKQSAQNEANISSSERVGPSTIDLPENGLDGNTEKERDVRVDQMPQIEMLAIGNSTHKCQTDSVLPQPQTTSHVVDSRRMEVVSNQPCSLQLKQSNSRTTVSPDNENTLSIDLNETSPAVRSQPSTSDFAPARTQCQQSNTLQIIPEKMTQLVPAIPAIQEVTLLIFNIGFFWKGGLFQRFDQWKQCIPCTYQVTFACSWCNATLSYANKKYTNHARMDKRINDIICAQFIQTHAGCFAMLRYKSTVSMDHVMLTMSSNGKEENYFLRNKVPAMGWIYETIYNRFVNCNYRHFNNVEKVPVQYNDKICRQPVITTCKICCNWTKDIRHMELEFPLSLPLFTIQRLVDYESIKNLPSRVVVDLIKTEQPFNVNKVAMDALEKHRPSSSLIISKEIVFDMFDANEAAWPWLREKFGLSETLANGAIWVKTEELFTMVNGRKINRVSREGIRKSLLRQTIDWSTELSNDATLQRPLLTRRLKRKMPFVNLVESTPKLPRPNPLNQQNSDEAGRAGSSTMPSQVPQSRPSNAPNRIRYAKTLGDVLRGLPVKPESEPENHENEEDDDCYWVPNEPDPSKLRRCRGRARHLRKLQRHRPLLTEDELDDARQAEHQVYMQIKREIIDPSLTATLKTEPKT